jgi:hypothetical protein
MQVKRQQLKKFSDTATILGSKGLLIAITAKGVLHIRII